MATHLDRHIPYADDRDRIPRSGMPPMVLVVALLLVAAFIWILVR